MEGRKDGKALFTKQSKTRSLSRYGCRNCKLRKVKCDESRPHCKRCHAYGVACNFGYNTPDLKPLQQVQVTPKTTSESQVRLLPPRALISNAIWSANESTLLNLDQTDQNLFCQFRSRTVPTLGGSALVRVYEGRILKDSFTSPALMHGILAMTAAHDRYLSSRSIRKCDIREIYHSSQCAILFSKWLRQPISEDHKDAIWATAVILAILAWSSIGISSFEDAWPLKPSDTSYLQWLRLKASDNGIWALANPLRSGSVFCAVSDTFLHNIQLPNSSADGVSAQLAELCRLDEESTSENNMYFDFVHPLSRLLELRKGEAPLGMVFMMVSANPGSLQVLLEAKDPVALLLLYLWYTRARESRWWIDLRARFEVPAIRTYLQRHYEDIRIIQVLLQTNNYA